MSYFYSLLHYSLILSSGYKSILIKVLKLCINLLQSLYLKVFIIHKSNGKCYKVYITSQVFLQNTLTQYCTDI